MTRGVRLDELLVQRGFFDDLHAAQAAVLAGEVVVGEHRETQAGKRLADDVAIRLKRGKEKDRMGFASRGGGKLEAALGFFSVSPEGLSCIDLGCSTGGFTDCLLQHGAAHVAAVDVGYAEFDWRLRNDGRVSLFERTNVCGLGPAQVGGPFDLAVADLSFISILRVLDDVHALLKPDGRFICLVKPQFEAGKAEVGRGGIVSSPESHARILVKVLEGFGAHGFEVLDATYSPVRGTKGNIEFLVLAQACEESACPPGRVSSDDVASIVAKAHDKIGRRQ